MATTEEIQRRVEQADAARGAKRSAAAQQVGELAQRRAALAEQLDDIERQLGEILAEAREVIDIDELARFTDVPAADLTRWHEARKTTRTKRRRPAAGAPGAERDRSRGPSTARTPARTPTRTPTAGQASTPPEPAVSRADAADAPERVAAGVT